LPSLLYTSHTITLLSKVRAVFLKDDLCVIRFLPACIFCVFITCYYINSTGQIKNVHSLTSRSRHDVIFHFIKQQKLQTFLRYQYHCTELQRPSATSC